MHRADPREQMIEQQVRAWDVLDARVLEVMRQVPRELFVPHGQRYRAYADVEVPLAHAQHMLRPSVAGRLLQALLPGTGEAVLQIGAGTGFVTAGLRAMAAQGGPPGDLAGVWPGARRQLPSPGMRRGRRDSLFDQHLTLHEGNAMNRASTLALVLLAFSGAAQPKDLVGVFEDAVHNDPVIRQADANRLAAREARPQALAALLPQLSGTAGISGAHSAGYQDQVFQPPTAERFQITTDTNTRQWAVNLRQNVFSWANWMALKEAGREVAQAEATYQAAEQQLILRVAQAYFNVLAAEDGLEANQASLEAISRQLDQADKRFEVGLIAITDVQEAKAARDTAAAAVIAAKRTLATSEDQLQEI